jgi:hypothetical protein
MWTVGLVQVHKVCTHSDMLSLKLGFSCMSNKSKIFFEETECILNIGLYPSRLTCSFGSR